MASSASALICDVVLCYVAHGMENSSNDAIKRTCFQHFSADEISGARDTLWAGVAEENIPKIIRRQSLTTRKGAENTISDIINAINFISGKGKMPCFVVGHSDIGRLPLSQPSETCSILMCSRMAKMEARMEKAEKAMSENQCKVLDLEDEIEKIKHSAPSKTGPHKQNRQAYADAARQKNIQKQQQYSLQQPPTSGLVGATADLQGPTLYNLPYKPFIHGLKPTESLESLTPSLFDQGFKYPRNQRRRRPVIRGEKQGNSGLRGAPEPQRDIFVHRLVPETSERDLEEYMTENDMHPLVVERRSRPNAPLASFRAQIPLSSLNRALDKKHWPENVCVRRYFVPREKLQQQQDDQPPPPPPSPPPSPPQQPHPAQPLQEQQLRKSDNSNPETDAE